MIVSDSIFAAIVRITAISNICLIVLQPVGYSSFIFLHLARHQSHIAAVVYVVMPVILQGKFGLLVLGINHQSAGITVESMHHMSLTVLTGFVEVVVEHGLHIER